MTSIFGFYSSTVTGELAAIKLGTQLSTFAGQQGMTSMQIINAVQAGNATLASQLCDCCCKTQSAIQESNYLTERGFCNTNQTLAKGFADLGYATRDQTCLSKRQSQVQQPKSLQVSVRLKWRDWQNKLETEREKVSASDRYQQLSADTDLCCYVATYQRIVGWIAQRQRNKMTAPKDESNQLQHLITFLSIVVST